MRYIISSVMAVFIAMGSTAIAKGNLAKQKPIEVILKLSEYKFTPDNLKFETGKLYKLIVRNVGKIKHELDASAISNLAYTRKIQINDNKGNLIGEIKGSPTEVELGAGYELEWWFVPIATITDEEFVCLLPGHYEAGMKGKMSFH